MVLGKFMLEVKLGEARIWLHQAYGF